MRRAECAKLLAVLAAAYRRADMGEATARVYLDNLVDLDREACALAIQGLIRSSKWLPTVAEIRDAATATEAPPALEAWGKVCNAAGRRGAEWSPRFRCAITQRCVEAMGWRYICRSGNDAADRARFVQLYDELGRRERLAKVVALPLSGVGRIGSGGDK